MYFPYQPPLPPVAPSSLRLNGLEHNTALAMGLCTHGTEASPPWTRTLRWVLATRPPVQCPRAYGVGHCFGNLPRRALKAQICIFSISQGYFPQTRSEEKYKISNICHQPKPLGGLAAVFNSMGTKAELLLIMLSTRS